MPILLGRWAYATRYVYYQICYVNYLLDSIGVGKIVLIVHESVVSVVFPGSITQIVGITPLGSTLQ